MAKLYNLARMTTATVGTGTITLGSASPSYLTFALAGVLNGDIVDYAILDGANSEIGTGTYTSAGTTLTRTVTKSTNSNAAISLSGTAVVFIDARAETLNDASLFTTGTLLAARLPFSASPIANSLGADVALNNTTNFFDGPSVGQGTTGTWFASGTVSLIDTAGAAQIWCKLWDGTTVIASAYETVTTASFPISISLSGFIATPAGNIRISCKDISSVSGVIKFNGTGTSKDSTISAYRIA